MRGVLLLFLVLSSCFALEPTRTYDLIDNIDKASAGRYVWNEGSILLTSYGYPENSQYRTYKGWLEPQHRLGAFYKADLTLIPSTRKSILATPNGLDPTFGIYSIYNVYDTLDGAYSIPYPATCSKAVVTFTITLIDGAGTSHDLKLSKPTLVGADNYWQSFSFDISRYKSENIKLIFQTTPGQSTDTSCQWAAWSDLKLNAYGLVPDICGDQLCTGSETCESCQTDCMCRDTECCEPSALSSSKSGCVPSGSKLTTGYCCSGQKKQCCTNSDCGPTGICANNNCVNSCGNGACDFNENCESCSKDCGCAEGCCSPSATTANTGGCVPVGSKISSSIVCCADGVHSGDCCTDEGCLSEQRCVSYSCQTPKSVASDLAKIGGSPQVLDTLNQIFLTEGTVLTKAGLFALLCMAAVLIFGVGILISFFNRIMKPKVVEVEAKAGGIEVETKVVEEKPGAVKAKKSEKKKR